MQGRAALQQVHNTQNLRVVTKAAVLFHQRVKRPLTTMSKRWVTDVVAERKCLAKRFVYKQCAADAARNLANLKTVA
jgi:hypothetical protein